MDYDTNKIDDDVLALLYLVSFRDSPHDEYYRAWKGHDWDATCRLHEKGLISNPKGKSKSIVFTAEGFARAKKLFEEKYAKP